MHINKSKLKICVIGLGNVGLTIAVCSASEQCHVIGLDIDFKKVAALKKACPSFYEPGLKDLLEEKINSGSLSFTNSYAKAIKFANVILLCLPTPNSSNNECDISALIAAITTLSQFLTNNCLLIIKSTIPPGTTEKLRILLEQNLEKQKKKVSFELLFSPEFLSEGDAIENFNYPSRIIFGTKSPSKYLQEYINSFPMKQNILFMSERSAELTKYAANSMLAARISFMNEFGQIAEKAGANILEVAKGIGQDPRVGPHFLEAGIGFGGSCLPKDLETIKNYALAQNINPIMIKSTLNVNRNSLRNFLTKIKNYCSHLNTKKITVWGVTFKPNTNDLRSSLALKVIHYLKQQGAAIQIYDPLLTKKETNDIQVYNCKIYECPIKAAKDAFGIVLCTKWSQFNDPNLLKNLHSTTVQVIFDGRNFINPDNLPCKIAYFGIGR